MKFLIIRLSSLGDIILTQPVIAELQGRYPGAEIHFVCKPGFAELLPMMAHNVTVIPYQKSLRWHIALRDTRYHAVFDLHAKAASLLISAFCRSMRVLRYSKRRALRLAIVRHKSSAAIRSTVDLYYSALRQLFKADPQTLLQPCLMVPEQVDLSVLPPRDQAVRRVAIFAGAAHATKKYPIGQWIGFMRCLGERYQYLLLGSQDDAAEALTIHAAFPDCSHDLCGKLSLTQLVATLNTCDLVLSGDTGPMHLAAALGIKQIAIFGSTHPRLGFAPLNRNAVVLCANLQCQPCSLHGNTTCPQAHFNCMRSIAPEAVADAARKLLDSPH